jgi:hypothetical protein
MSRYLTKPIKVNEFMETLDVGMKIRKKLRPNQWRGTI